MWNLLIIFFILNSLCFLSTTVTLFSNCSCKHIRTETSGTKDAPEHITPSVAKKNKKKNTERLKLGQAMRFHYKWPGRNVEQKSLTISNTKLTHKLGEDGFIWSEQVRPLLQLLIAGFLQNKKIKDVMTERGRFGTRIHRVHIYRNDCCTRIETTHSFNLFQSGRLCVWVSTVSFLNQIQKLKCLRSNWLNQPDDSLNYLSVIISIIWTVTWQISVTRKRFLTPPWLSVSITALTEWVLVYAPSSGACCGCVYSGVCACCTWPVGTRWSPWTCRPWPSSGTWAESGWSTGDTHSHSV